MSRLTETIVALRQAGYDHDADELEGTCQRLAETMWKQAESEQKIAGTTTVQRIQESWPLPPQGTAEVVYRGVIERLFPDGGLDKASRGDVAEVGAILAQLAEMAKDTSEQIKHVTTLLAKAERSLRHG